MELMHKINVIMSLTNKNIEKDSNNIEIKDSLIHGKGIFAKKDLPKNLLITQYPINFLIDTTENNAVILCPDLYDSNNFQASLKKCIDYSLNIDIPDLNKKYLLVGDPNYCKNHNLIGHLFNDKAVVGLDRKTYNQQLNNCYIQNTEIYTAREIKKGEELSFSYGENYWYHKNFSGKKRINDIIF